MVKPTSCTKPLDPSWVGVPEIEEFCHGDQSGLLCFHISLELGSVSMSVSAVSRPTPQLG